MPRGLFFIAFAILQPCFFCSCFLVSAFLQSVPAFVRCVFADWLRVCTDRRLE